jgi:lysophospholipase L1-like esterase
MDKSKKIFLVILSSIVVVGLTTAVIIRVVRKNKSRKVKIRNKNPKNILIVGDSQSAIETSSGQNIAFTYPNILRDKLSSKGVTIDVLALQGKTTGWMLSNLPAQLSKKKYDRVIIYGGGNDTSNSSIPLSKTLSNFQKMVDLSRANGADVFINLGYKIQGDFGNYQIMPTTTYINEKEDWIPFVEKRKELQRLLPLKINNANFIPAYDLKSQTTDGIHPTASGHRIVADKVYDSIVKKY